MRMWCIGVSVFTAGQRMIVELLLSHWLIPDLLFRLVMLSLTSVSILITADVIMDWGLFC